MPGLFGGGDMGDAAQEAARVQAAAAERAAQLQYQMYQEAVKREQPWVTAGGGGTPAQWGNVGGAVGQLAGIYNIPGATPVDPTKTLQGTPGYQWLLGQGTQARDMSAASRGLALSGAHQKGLTDFGQNLAQTYAWNPYVQGVTGLSNAGQSGAALQGQQGIGTGQAMGQDYMAAGQAQAQGIWNSAQANQNQSSGWGSLLGLGLGALLAPMTGGMSLIGAGANAAGNWFGGGGGGGGGAPSYNLGSWGSGGGGNYGMNSWGG